MLEREVHGVPVATGNEGKELRDSAAITETSGFLPVALLSSQISPRFISVTPTVSAKATS